VRSKRRITLKEAIRQIIEAKLKDRSVLVWYDPEKSFEDLVEKIEFKPAKINLVKFKGSYLEIRVKIEEEDPELQGKWLIYVPEEPPKPSWLRDYELAGERLILSLPELCERYQNHPLFYSKIKGLLKGERGRLLVKWWDDFFEDISDISRDKIEEALLAISIGVKPGFGAGKIVTTLLENPEVFENLDKLGLKDVLKDYAKNELGLELKEKDNPPLRIAQALFLSELVEYGKVNPLPYQDVLPEENKRRKWADWLREWIKNSNPEKIQEFTRKIEKDYDLKNKLTGWEIANVAGILCVDEILLEQIKRLLENQQLGKVKAFVMNIAQKRFQLLGDKRLRYPWRGIILALQVLEESEKAVNELKTRKNWSLDELFNSFKDKWWKIDANFLSLETYLDKLSPWIKTEIVRRAFGAYVEYIDILGHKVGETLEQKKAWRIKGWKSQKEVLRHLLHLDKKDFSIILVDALSFVLAQNLVQELKKALGEGYIVEKIPTLASLPSITPVGMSLIVPIEEPLFIKIEKEKPIFQRAEVNVGVAEGRNKLWVNIFPSLKILTLEEAESQELKLSGKPLLIISREIDQINEGLWILKVDTFENILKRIANVVKKLLQAKYNAIVITSDHGFIWIPKNKNPQTLTLRKEDKTVVDRRYAIGRPEKIPDTIRIPLSAICLKGSGDIVFPKGFRVFGKQGPISAFLHGGYLPQETTLLTLIVKPKVIRRPVKLRLIPQKITTFIPIFTIESEISDEYTEPRTVKVVLFCEERKIGCSENVEIQKPGERKRTKPIRLQKINGRVRAKIIDVHTREILDEKELKVALPEDYKEDIL